MTFRATSARRSFGLVVVLTCAIAATLAFGCASKEAEKMADKEQVRQRHQAEMQRELSGK